MAYVKNFVDAFWEKVHVKGEDECWPWLASCYHDGYGQVGIRRADGSRTTMRAHVLSLIFATAEDVAGRYALHHCDNPPCCNPRHLYWGDQKRNIADMDVRGRANRPVLRGEAHGGSRLKNRDVLAIRQLYGTGLVSQQRLADLYGVHQSIVSDIVRRVTWRHL